MSADDGELVLQQQRTITPSALDVEPVIEGRPPAKSPSLRSRALNQYRQMMLKEKPVRKQPTANVCAAELEGAAIHYALSCAMDREMSLTKEICVNLRKTALEVVENNEADLALGAVVTTDEGEDECLFNGESLKGLVTEAVYTMLDSHEPDDADDFYRHNHGRATSQGTRTVQEDASLVLPFMGDLCGFEDKYEHCAYYGVFDGHNGHLAARYVEQHLYYNIGRQLREGVEPQDALRNAFLETEERFHKKSGRELLNDGTTAVVLLCINDEIFFAHCGDSVALMSINGKSRTVCEAHSPKRPDEEERIKSAGGAVVWYGTWRVNGVLAVSRSIGDVHLKDVVIAEPELSTETLSSEHEFVILATDGLWDVFSTREAAAFVRSRLIDGLEAQEVADALVAAALERMTADNTTVVIVCFNPPDPESVFEATSGIRSFASGSDSTPNSPRSPDVPAPVLVNSSGSLIEAELEASDD